MSSGSDLWARLSGAKDGDPGGSQPHLHAVPGPGASPTNLPSGLPPGFGSPQLSNDTHPAPLVAKDGAMFERGDLVRHLKTFRLYVILLAPPMSVIEASGEPCYAYQQHQGPDPRIWIRPMHDMEEAGRFVLHKKRPHL